jgi:hypothetical protein
MINAINQSQLATMTSGVIRASGAGKAYQSVAQSGAIAIQDAVDYMRNVQTMTVTATGLAIAQLFVGNANAQTVINQAQTVMTNGIQNFTQICAAVTTMLTSFPSG